MENWDAVVNKREWLAMWTRKSFAEQLIGAACLHGLMFTSLNLVHSWLQNKMRASMGHELVDILEKMIHDQVNKSHSQEINSHFILHATHLFQFE